MLLCFNLNRLKVDNRDINRWVDTTLLEQVPVQVLVQLMGSVSGKG